MSLGPNFGNVAGGESSGKKGNSTPYFPARVKEVITSDSTDPKSLFVQNGGWASLGFISFHPLFGPVDANDKGNLIAKPLFSNLTQIPLVNEIVLIFQAPNILNDDPQSQQFYYLTTVSIWNSVHHNGFPDLQNLEANTKKTMLADYSKIRAGVQLKPKNEIKQLNLGTKFVEDPAKARNLIPQQGDMIISGRFGNSIRFSHTAKTDKSSKALNTWSVSGSNTDPITIIRNGQRDLDPKLPKWLPTVEDINLDDSSVWLTSGQEIKIDYASKNLRSYKMAVALPAADVVNVPNIVIEPKTTDAGSADQELLNEAQEKQKTATQAASNSAASGSTSAAGVANIIGSSGTSGTLPIGTQQVLPQKYVYEIQKVGIKKFIVVFENIVKPPSITPTPTPIYTGTQVDPWTPDDYLVNEAKRALIIKIGVVNANSIQPITVGGVSQQTQAASQAKSTAGTAGNAAKETPPTPGSKANPLPEKQMADVGMPGEEINSVVYQTQYAETEVVTDVALTGKQAEELDRQTQGTNYFNNAAVTFTFAGGNNTVSVGNAVEVALGCNPANKSLPIINQSFPVFSKGGAILQDIYKVNGVTGGHFCAYGVSYCFKKAEAASPAGTSLLPWRMVGNSQGIYDQVINKKYNNPQQVVQLEYPTDITPSGITQAGAAKLSQIGGWGGAVFAWGQGKGGQGHIGIVVKIAGDIIYTIEYNTSAGPGGSQSTGGGLFLRKRKIVLTSSAGRELASPNMGIVDVNGKKYFKYYGFVNTSGIIGGSWAPKGIANSIVLPGIPTAKFDPNNLNYYS